MGEDREEGARLLFHATGAVEWRRRWQATRRFIAVEYWGIPARFSVSIVSVSNYDGMNSVSWFNGLIL